MFFHDCLGIMERKVSPGATREAAGAFLVVAKVKENTEGQWF